MIADQLRVALVAVEYPKSVSPLIREIAQRQVVDAARSWLTLLEGDETTIEKVAQYLYESDYPPKEYESWSGDDPRKWINYDERMKALYMHRARAVLAAIVGEEQ